MHHGRDDTTTLSTNLLQMLATVRETEDAVDTHPVTRQMGRIQYRRLHDSTVGVGRSAPTQWSAAEMGPGLTAPVDKIYANDIDSVVSDARPTGLIADVTGGGAPGGGSPSGPTGGGSPGGGSPGGSPGGPGTTNEPMTIGELVDAVDRDAVDQNDDDDLRLRNPYRRGGARGARSRDILADVESRYSRVSQLSSTRIGEYMQLDAMIEGVQSGKTFTQTLLEFNGYTGDSQWEHRDVMMRNARGRLNTGARMYRLDWRDAGGTFTFDEQVELNRYGDTPVRQLLTPAERNTFIRTDAAGRQTVIQEDSFWNVANRYSAGDGGLRVFDREVPLPDNLRATRAASQTMRAMPQATLDRLLSDAVHATNNATGVGAANRQLENVRAVTDGTPTATQQLENARLLDDPTHPFNRTTNSSNAPVTEEANAALDAAARAPLNDPIVPGTNMRMSELRAYYEAGTLPPEMPALDPRVPQLPLLPELPQLPQIPNRLMTSPPPLPRAPRFRPQLDKFRSMRDSAMLPGSNTRQAAGSTARNIGGLVGGEAATRGLESAGVDFENPALRDLSVGGFGAATGVGLGVAAGVSSAVLAPEAAAMIAATSAGNAGGRAMEDVARDQWGANDGEASSVGALSGGAIGGMAAGGVLAAGATIMTGGVAAPAAPAIIGASTAIGTAFGGLMAGIGGWMRGDF